MNIIHIILFTIIFLVTFGSVLFTITLHEYNGTVYHSVASSGVSALVFKSCFDKTNKIKWKSVFDYSKRDISFTTPILMKLIEI